REARRQLDALAQRVLHVGNPLTRHARRERVDDQDRARHAVNIASTALAYDEVAADQRSAPDEARPEPEGVAVVSPVVDRGHSERDAALAVDQAGPADEHRVTAEADVRHGRRLEVVPERPAPVRDVDGPVTCPERAPPERP